MSRFAAALLLAALPFACAHAQSPTGSDDDGAGDDTGAPAPPDCCRIEAGHAIDLEIAQPLNSWEFKRGDAFRLTVAAPVVVNGHELIPVGTPVAGEIVHADAARGGGAPGELLIAARSLEIDGRNLRLRGLKLGGAGQDNSQLAIGVSMGAGPFAMFIRGREIEIPQGTRVHARLAEAIDFAPAANESSPQFQPELP
ncbi:hypothetical protein [Luteimonas saliphila]|uniref:hypothetical protein n=1 Tax=Luteimonas saliphila TaxID=2804919 RepID=UPI00192D6507|nr:hypothetical protein [Luteimonas saliphila]